MRERKVIRLPRHIFCFVYPLTVRAFVRVLTWVCVLVTNTRSLRVIELEWHFGTRHSILFYSDVSFCFFWLLVLFYFIFCAREFFPVWLLLYFCCYRLRLRLGCSHRRRALLLPPLHWFALGGTTVRRSLQLCGAKQTSFGRAVTTAATAITIGTIARPNPTKQQGQKL